MHLRYILLALLMALVWGSNFSVMKIGLEGTYPLVFSALRSLVLFPLLFFIPKPKTSWKNIFLIGFLIGTVKLPLMLLAIHWGVPAGLSSVLSQTQVFFTILLAILFYKEHPKLNNWIGMLIAFGGIGCIALQIGGETSYVGLLPILMAAFSWAIANILTQHTKKNVDMLQLTVWFNIVPPLPLLGLAGFIHGWEEVYLNIMGFSWKTIATILYSGFFAGLLGYTIWGSLLKKYPATIVAPFSLLVPVCALSFAYIVLHEQPTPLSLLGAVFVILGLILNQIKFKQKDLKTVGD
jgi:O-acetylserine/cysteine efflux transporter